jgi:hypothetical protein
MFKVPEQFRKKEGVFATTESHGRTGVFNFRVIGYDVQCIVSDGSGWDHVSVTINRNRTPTWEIMCIVKDLFWDKTDTILQFHPAESDYVNMHPHCLHLWRYQAHELPKPHPLMIGYKK